MDQLTDSRGIAGFVSEEIDISERLDDTRYADAIENQGDVSDGSLASGDGNTGGDVVSNRRVSDKHFAGANLDSAPFESVDYTILNRNGTRRDYVDPMVTCARSVYRQTAQTHCRG